MPNACKYFIKIVFDGQGALIAVSLIINLEFVMFYNFNHSPMKTIQLFNVFIMNAPHLP